MPSGPLYSLPKWITKPKKDSRNNKIQGRTPNLLLEQDMLPRKVSIALVVIVTGLTITTLLLAAFGFINYRAESEQRWNQLNTDLAISADKLVTALALPIWNIDRAQIDKNLESAMKDPTIYGVALNREGLVGSPIHARVRGQQWEIKESDGKFPSNGLLVAERLITFKNKSVGTLRLFATPKFMQAHLHNILFTTISSIILLDLLLVLSLYFVFWQFVLNPLKKIEQFALAVSSGSSGDTALPSRVFRGELDSLRSSIEKMVTLLNARFEELRQSEQRFRVLVEQAPDAILVLDIKNRRFVDANISAERLFGCIREELLTSDLLRFYLPSQPDGRPISESLSEHIEQTLAGQEVVFERAIRNAQGIDIYCEVRLAKLPSPDRKLIRVSYIDITERKQFALEREQLITELQNTLSGILPICANCKKIRDDQGYWNQIEKYISERSNALFTHSICPECIKELYPELTDLEK